MKSLFKFLRVLSLVAACLIGWTYWQGQADPEVRTYHYAAPEWPKGAPSVRIALISDLHMIEPDMPASRVDRLVAQINALKPDCVLIAGDMFSGKRFATRELSWPEISAPLKKLKPAIGVYAVLGNHDYWHEPEKAVAAMTAAGVKVLRNQAAACGPLALGGVDDEVTEHANVPMTEAAMKLVPGLPVIFTHSPDLVPDVTAAKLILAGHTHCGQIALPFYGRVTTSSRFGQRYGCGKISEAGRTIIVTAGLGTSILPLRWNAPPDFWLVTVGR